MARHFVYEGDFRQWSPEEKQVVMKLLSVPFEGREIVEEQIAHSRVCTVDEPHCRTLEIVVDRGRALPYSNNFVRLIPVEGWYLGQDGIPVEILLYQRLGFVTELEFVVYVDRQGPLPSPEEIELRVRQVNDHTLT